MRSPTSDSIGEVRRRSSIGQSFRRLSWDKVEVPSIQQALRPISEQSQQFSSEIDLSENIIELPIAVEPTSPSSTIREESFKVAFEEKTPTPIKRITRRLSNLLAKDKLQLSPIIEEESNTTIIDKSNNIQEKKIREITQESPLSGSKSFFDHIFNQNKAKESLTKSIQEHYQDIYEEYFHRMKQSAKKKTQKDDSQANTNTNIPLLHVDFTKLVDDTINKSKTNAKIRGRTGKLQESKEETSLSRIERLLKCFFQSLHYHDIICQRETIHQQLMTYLLPGDKPSYDELKFIISMIKRIIYSTRRILSYVLPTPSHQHPRAIWDNILLIKRFRATSVLEVDQTILQEYYRQFKSLAYAIAESPDDDLSSTNKKKLMKNRLMLSIDDSSLNKTPILQEIYYAIAALVKDSHEIESFAFLFSPKYGYEQQPHIDYNYDITNPLNLLQKRESQDRTVIPFFHPQMSFSFIYALEDDTTLHFINPLDEARMSLHANAGDLLIWSGQQIHYGAKYSQSSNLRLFGNIRSKHCPKAENEFYWYDEENKCIESLQPPSLIPMTQL